jgi:hypothetical protein
MALHSVVVKASSYRRPPSPGARANQLVRNDCYVAIGTEEEKLALLRQFAVMDYRVASVFPLPGRFHTTFHSSKGNYKLPVIGIDSLDLLGGVHVLFEDAFVALENAFPATTKLTIGPTPLVCITPLLGNEEGELIPMVSGNRRGTVGGTKLINRLLMS